MSIAEIQNKEEHMYGKDSKFSLSEDGLESLSNICIEKENK